MNWRFHIMWSIFACRFSYMNWKFHMWFFFAYKILYMNWKFPMWFLFSYRISYVNWKFHMWFFSHIELRIWIGDFICDRISHITFYIWIPRFRIWNSMIHMSNFAFICEISISYVKFIISYMKFWFHIWNYVWIFRKGSPITINNNILSQINHSGETRVRRNPCYWLVGLFRWGNLCQRSWDWGYSFSHHKRINRNLFVEM